MSERQPGDSKIEEMKRLLEETRKGGDLYPVARRVQILQSLGEDIHLTEDESARLFEELDKARMGNSERRAMAQGYEIARWIFLLQFFKPELGMQASPEDIKKIERAMKEYYEEGNFQQMASLKQTCDYIGVPIYPRLSSDEERQFLEELEKLRSEDHP